MTEYDALLIHELEDMGLHAEAHEVYEHSSPNPGELEAMRNEWDTRDEVLYPAWLERDPS